MKRPPHVDERPNASVAQLPHDAQRLVVANGGPPSSASAQLTALAVAMETLKTALGALPPAGGQGPAVPQGPAGEAQAGVSSFAPTSAPGTVSAAQGVRGASAPGGADAGLAATPMGQAQGALAQEQQRLQREKYDFLPTSRRGPLNTIRSWARRTPRSRRSWPSWTRTSPRSARAEATARSSRRWRRSARRSRASSSPR
ncbi:hypothetical protein ACN28S_47350 [Cystobacter fuscus]